MKLFLKISMYRFCFCSNKKKKKPARLMGQAWNAAFCAPWSIVGFLVLCVSDLSRLSHFNFNRLLNPIQLRFRSRNTATTFIIIRRSQPYIRVDSEDVVGNGRSWLHQPDVAGHLGHEGSHPWFSHGTPHSSNPSSVWFWESWGKWCGKFESSNIIF